MSHWRRRMTPPALSGHLPTQAWGGVSSGRAVGVGKVADVERGRAGHALELADMPAIGLEAVFDPAHFLHAIERLDAVGNDEAGRRPPDMARAVGLAVAELVDVAGHHKCGRDVT